MRKISKWPPPRVFFALGWRTDFPGLVFLPRISLVAFPEMLKLISLLFARLMRCLLSSSKCRSTRPRLNYLSLDMWLCATSYASIKCVPTRTRVKGTFLLPRARTRQNLIPLWHSAGGDWGSGKLFFVIQTAFDLYILYISYSRCLL